MVFSLGVQTKQSCSTIFAGNLSMSVEIELELAYVLSVSPLLNKIQDKIRSLSLLIYSYKVILPLSFVLLNDLLSSFQVVPIFGL